MKNIAESCVHRVCALSSSECIDRCLRTGLARLNSNQLNHIALRQAYMEIQRVNTNLFRKRRDLNEIDVVEETFVPEDSSLFDLTSDLKDLLDPMYDSEDLYPEDIEEDKYSEANKSVIIDESDLTTMKTHGLELLANGNLIYKGVEYDENCSPIMDIDTKVPALHNCHRYFKRIGPKTYLEKICLYGYIFDPVSERCSNSTECVEYQPCISKILEYPTEFMKGLVRTVHLESDEDL